MPHPVYEITAAEAEHLEAAYEVLVRHKYPGAQWLSAFLHNADIKDAE